MLDASFFPDLDETQDTFVSAPVVTICPTLDEHWSKATQKRIVQAIHQMPPWRCVSMPLELQDPSLVHDLRAQFCKVAKKMFVKEAVCSIKGRGAKAAPFINQWPVHHVIPLSLGGDNEQLALCAPLWHIAIHQIIASQTWGMKVGEMRSIDIPLLSGSVWGLTQEFVERCQREPSPKTRRASYLAQSRKFFGFQTDEL